MISVPAWYTRPVSRETSDTLAAYAALIEKWTQRINLISPGTTDCIFDRHIWDSAQIYHGQAGLWADLGSGGGLPGIVIAILRKGDGVTTPVVLLESDKRKATFLRTCGRELGLAVVVKDQRIEDAEPLNADIVSARALRDLSGLMPLLRKHVAGHGECLVMKGEKWQQEIQDAQCDWRFSCDVTPSKTNPDAAILKIRDIERV